MKLSSALRKFLVEGNFMEKMMKYVVHKNSRLPGDVSYTGATLDIAGLRNEYKETYDSYEEALSFAKKLTPFNPGVGFDASPVEE
jgi:hypothetical protein